MHGLSNKLFGGTTDKITSMLKEVGKLETGRR